MDPYPCDADELLSKLAKFATSAAPGALAGLAAGVVPALGSKSPKLSLAEADEKSANPSDNKSAAVALEKAVSIRESNEGWEEEAGMIASWEEMEI